MCIITFHLQDHDKFKLIIAANRDEFYNRPTEAAHFWKEHPEIVAGRDLKAMGTWLGITKEGRFAALTNYRDPANEHQNKVSRGEIVTSFLTSNLSAPDFLQNLRNKKDDFNGFNVIVGSPDELYYYGNRQEKITKLTSGTYSISNKLLNTPWPKVENARSMLTEYIMTNDSIEIEALFAQLNNNTISTDEFLPSTGIDIELERELSAIFIKTNGYGTRSSTVLLVTHNNEVTFIERTYDHGAYQDENKFEFNI